MNRAERRRRKLPAKTPMQNTFVMTRQQLNDQIHKEIEITRKEAVQFATTRALGAFIVALHDEFGFGQTRLERLLKEVSATFECVAAGTVTLDELTDLCESFGIVLQEGDKEYKGY